MTTTYPSIVAELLDVPLGPWAFGDAADDMSAIEASILPFAHSIHVKASAIETLDLSSKQQARVRESMLDDLKKCSDVLIPDVRPPLVSLAADDAASRIPVDLLQAGWHDQPKFDVGRRVFHWEHVTPLAQLGDSLAHAATAEEVQSMISARLYVAWITKDEDHALTAADFKSKRPQTLGRLRLVRPRTYGQASPPTVPASADCIR